MSGVVERDSASGVVERDSASGVVERDSASGVVERRTRILVARPDRIGDVVLSTPVLEAIKRQYPDAEVFMLVREAVAPLVELNPFVSGLLVYRPGSVHRGFAGFWRLAREIRERRFDVAVVLQAAFFVSAAILAARVRHRVGPYSKWFSYLFFNRGMRQNRSAVEMHETDYNLMLLRRIGIRAGSLKFEPTLVVDAGARERMRAFVRQEGFVEGIRFVVVHPGMGGSALNWPEGYYIDLVQRLAARGVRVVVSGSTRERALTERVIASVKEHGPSLPIIQFVGASSPSGLADLMALLSLAHVIVAPSTGPLHIAAALGKRTVSFYPPIRVQSALRWGPYAAAEGRHHVLVPDALCGQDFNCAGRRCHFYYCMERMGVDEAFHGVMTHLEAVE